METRLVVWFVKYLLKYSNSKCRNINLLGHTAILWSGTDWKNEKLISFTVCNHNESEFRIRATIRNGERLIFDGFLHQNPNQMTAVHSFGGSFARSRARYVAHAEMLNKANQLCVIQNSDERSTKTVAIDRMKMETSHRVKGMRLSLGGKKNMATKTKSHHIRYLYILSAVDARVCMCVWESRVHLWLCFIVPSQCNEPSELRPFFAIETNCGCVCVRDLKCDDFVIDVAKVTFPVAISTPTPLYTHHRRCRRHRHHHQAHQTKSVSLRVAAERVFVAFGV